MSVIPYSIGQADENVVCFKIDSGEWEDCIFGIYPPRITKKGGLDLSLQFIDYDDGIDYNNIPESLKKNIDEIVTDYVHFILSNEQYKIKGKNE